MRNYCDVGEGVAEAAGPKDEDRNWQQARQLHIEVDLFGALEEEEF